jgi:hypothetical protein
MVQVTAGPHRHGRRAAKALAMTALDLLAHHEELTRAKAEFRRA